MSMVAEVTMTFRSRRLRSSCFRYPSRKSMLRLRSCASSTMIAVVVRQPAVAGDLRQQDAVGHEFDARVVADVVVEAHLVADRAAQRHLQLLGHAAGHRARGDAARLGAADHAGRAAPGRQAQLGQLGGLARAGLAGDHHDLVLADQLDDPLALARDRQRLVQGHRRQVGRARLAGGHRLGQRLAEARAQLRVLRCRLPARPQAVQAATVAAQRAIDGAPRGVGLGGKRGD
ncbi:hypothetical protein QE386_003795 [Pseudoxanthomonas winnipegensis]|nr:hypothetical protein [Pseudoxanthomonas winnipegensis]